MKCMTRKQVFSVAGLGTPILQNNQEHNRVRIITFLKI